MNKVITDIEKLTEPSSPLEFIDSNGAHPEEGQKIIDQIKEVMEADKSLIALSAPQIGINKRIFCIRFENEIKTFINPIITKKADYKVGIETCVSMPGKEILITRPESITLVYYNDNFKYEDNKLLGYAARIFDQQANILDGVLPNELGLVSDINEDGPFSSLTEDEIKEVLDLYKKFVAAKSEALAKQIAADEDLQKQYKHLKFTEAVINDRIQVIENPDDKKPVGNRAQRRAVSKQIKHQISKQKQKADIKKGKK